MQVSLLLGSLYLVDLVKKNLNFYVNRRMYQYIIYTFIASG